MFNDAFQQQTIAPQLTIKGRLWRGPMVPIGSQTIFYLELNLQQYLNFQKVVKMGGGSWPRESAILGAIRQDFYEPLLRYIFSLIKFYVPRDKGRLQNSMEIAVRDQSLVYGLSPFHVFLNTGNVKYATVVNAMSNEELKHPGIGNKTLAGNPRNLKQTAKGRKKGFVGKPLFDPNAEQFWFEIVLSKSRQYAQIQWVNFLSSSAFLNNLFGSAVNILGFTPPSLMQIIFPNVRFS